jgi:hypothetical protein
MNWMIIGQKATLLLMNLASLEYSGRLRLGNFTRVFQKYKIGQVGELK